MIRVVFTKSNMFIGKLIQKIIKGLSHSMIQTPNSVWGGEWITESTFPMVIQHPAEQSRHNIFAEFECLFDAKKGFKRLRPEFGRLYDIPGLFGFGWVILLWRVFKIKTKNPFASSKALVCSEFITLWFQGCELPDVHKWQPEKSSPARLYRYCLKHPELFRAIKENDEQR